MIRAAADSDASQVYQLIAQLQQFAGVEVVEEAAFIRQFRQVLADPRFRAFVAEEPEAIKGMITIWLRESLFHGRPVALIDELIIDESSRGQGLGSQLIDHVVAYCTRLGCEEVEVSTEADNLAARNFYARHGFVERGVLLERELEEGCGVLWPRSPRSLFFLPLSLGGASVKLKGLDLILTYECTGRCAHCCYRAGPGWNETMTVSEVEGYLAAVADQPLEWVLLFGGEPFICYDLLRECVALAAPLAPVLVFTNGYWATDPDTARQRLTGLQEAGLDYILFSVDAFHQAHVPLERIAIGIEAARELGYGTIEIDNRCLEEPDADNPFNRCTRAIMARLAELCDLADVNVIQGPARMVGRAADRLSPYLATQAAPPTECPLPDYLGGDLTAPTGVEIHPGGWVNLCAGLALGNAQQRPLEEILADYDPDAHPIIRVLAREGPAGLLRLAQRHGYSPGRGYVDGCHLCYETRRFLRPYYPDHLAPARPYAEPGEDV